MLWRTPITSQRLTLRGGSAMPCIGRPVDGYASEHKPGRWQE
jgi:hypothetical protein